MSKFLGLATVIKSVQAEYQQLVAQGDTKATKQIETMVGAGIWYLPTGQKEKLLWTGWQSKESIRLNECSEEHINPRKLQATKLLLLDWSEIDDSEQYLKDLYYEKLGKFHKVSKRENKKLVPYQKAGVFTTWEDAYAKVGIELVYVRE